MHRVLIPLLIAAGLAPAAVIDSNTIAYNVDGTENDYFNQFNPALGTLTSVTLFYYNSYIYMTAFASIGETATPAYVYANFEAGFDLTLPDIPTFNEFLSLTQNDYGCTSSTGEFSSCSVNQLFQTGPLSGSVLLSPSSLSPYIGTGTLLSQLVSEVDISGLNPATPGNYYLQYTYTPTSAGTPEPATFGFTALGLLAVGFLLRRPLKTRLSEEN